MSTRPHGPVAGHATPRQALTARGAVGLATAAGLAAGYLDLLIIAAKKWLWHDQPYYWIARDAPWTVPTAHVVLLAIPGGLLAVVSRVRAGLISVRLGAWVLATLGLWSALLRAPLHGGASLALAVGLGVWVAEVVARWASRPRHGRRVLAGLVGLLAVLAIGSSGRSALRESRAVAGLPEPPPGARNVVLIVWDTVRSWSLSLHGYPRDTSPILTRLARRGVRYNLAVASAPWTFPSHTTLFTGHWAHRLDSQWNFTLDASEPTLAEYLAAHGYQTAGFSANTNCCSYETGLDRGFQHFEDYPLSPRLLLGRTVAGRWLLENVLYRDDSHARKWIQLQSRDAAGTNEAFLDWLDRRRQDRPFFAFLNFFDAHDPYAPPQGHSGRFGEEPIPGRDDYILRNFERLDKSRLPMRDLYMARDRYDDCIGYLDDQLGRLVEGLSRRGVMDDTLLIITSDHGEAFGDHGVFGHASGLHLDQTAVPLVMVGPGAPAGRVVFEPVSLRDLPATVVDWLGLGAGSPFPGRSLAAHWPRTEGPTPATSPAFSEVVNATAFEPQSRESLSRRGFQMSLVAGGYHYLRDGVGGERLYDLKRDLFELSDVIDSADPTVLASLRARLLEVVTAEPGSPTVEEAYLGAFRRWLASLVPDGTPAPRRRAALGAAEP